MQSSKIYEGIVVLDDFSFSHKKETLHSAFSFRPLRDLVEDSDEKDYALRCRRELKKAMGEFFGCDIEGVSFNDLYAEFEWFCTHYGIHEVTK